MNTQFGDAISRSKLIAEIEKAQQSLKTRDEKVLRKRNKKYRKGLEWALILTVGVPSINGSKFISRSLLVEQIKNVQKILESCDDKIWERNKPYFKGLAWAHRLVLDAPSVFDVQERSSNECELVDHESIDEVTDYPYYGDIGRIPISKNF